MDVLECPNTISERKVLGRAWVLAVRAGSSQGACIIPRDVDD